MATGANTTPLGRLHPILAARQSGPDPSPPSGGAIPMGGGGSRDPELKRHLEAAKRAASALFPGSEPVIKKKRRSRWASEDVKTVLPGLPTVLPANMNEEQQKLYLMHLKVEEIGRKLRTGDLGIPPNPGDRSPSPEPIYSHDGKRLNTREVRVRKKLEDERHDLVQQAAKLNAEYKPPADYKPASKKFEDKVFIPQEHHPETNFVGLLIGPRGNTLKQLEKDTNTKIMIRGKGATKEGKLGRTGLPQPGEDEPLHALITGLSPEAVKNAVDKIKAIIQSGIDVPGNDNDLKKLQLQQLAELNGTFKPLDILRCRNCGAAGHRSWECPEHQNITSDIICTRCGSGGHIASDCKTDLSANPPTMSVTDRAKMDSEYLSLMKELGESVPGGASTNPQASGNPSRAGMGVGTNVPPPAALTGHNNPHGMRMDRPLGPRPPWLNRPPPPPGHRPPPPHMMMGPHRGPHPWGAPPPPPPPHGHVPFMHGPGPGPMHGPGLGPMHGPGPGPMHGPGLGPMPGPAPGPMPGPAPGPMPPPPGAGPLPPPPSSVPSSTSASQKDGGQQPWQGAMPPWQQPVMYPGAPPLPGMPPPGPPLPPGTPPPPPPDHSWNGGAPPPPPPPPPAESTS